MQTLLLNDSDTVQQATQVLSLPQNTPDCTVYLLTGFLPIELQLHKKALVFFNICSQNEESIEKQLARRQLAVKSNNSNSWFVVIKKLLLKYNLNDPIYLLDHPVERQEWKREINKQLNTVWKEQIIHSLNLYQNLQYLSYDKYIPGKIHPILKVNCNSSRDVNRIPTKLKLITGTYILQSNRAEFRRGEINKICLLCGDEEETLEHFILYCPMLVSIRNPVIDDIVEALHIQCKITFDTLSVNEQLSLILDCSYLVKCHRNIERISNVEFHTRRLLHNLHSVRH
jgi:hypothetical protein